MRDIQDFDSLMIRLASPDTIRAWSYGEVKKPETINYRTLRPERDGLFCERIFGTTKEWECFCGKFKSIRYKGVICDRCGVEVTHFKVRRERMGHIELAAPVSHIWYYRSVPSRMGLLLNLQVAALRSVLYYEKYIVIDANDTDLEPMQLLTEDEYRDAHERYGAAFTAGMGAGAIKTLLQNINLDELAAQLRAKMIEKGAKSDQRLLRRIEIVENFRASGNKPEWMILDVIPVIPPDLRPMVQLDGGRFATSDLNDLYRRVIHRNSRLSKLMELKAPDIIIRNEKRMLQEAVDALFDNSKRKKAIKGASNRPLKSISDLLKGKQGRFRQNLLGKRVDYSGRSVIVVGPELKLWQCGLPTKMALELFKPFIMKKLVQKEVVSNIKKAKLLVEQEAAEVFAVLDEVVSEHPVLLNRAPTLHRLGIQAFEPVLVEGKAIRLHPLVCKAFNADFDGDQMAIHVPLTQAAQMECWTLMLSARNLLDPANGKTIVFPTQDMVLGLYYLTKERALPEGKKERLYSSVPEVLMAAECHAVGWQEPVLIDYETEPGKIETVRTTPGRILFNEEMPEGVPFTNYALNDKKIRKLIENVFKDKGPWLAVQLLDKLKAVGYKYATYFGATLSMEDMIIPPEKAGMLEKANKEVLEIYNQYKGGHITQEERYNRVVDVWQKTNSNLKEILMKRLQEDKGGFNTIHMMETSGARGSKDQINQLAGMRGLMSKPTGDIIELPIRSNFKEGLNVMEFFISTNGARKGLTDTALKTSDAGYLTRRLVDIAQNVVVNEEDCGTINGIEYAAIKRGDEIRESLSERIAGKYTLERVIHPITGELLIDVNEYITDETAKKIEEAGVETVKLRTVLTCESKHGVCVKCYGRDLARNRIVRIGEAVGIIAAQSIGQPGTQLTMRTFHEGGTASKNVEENRIVFNDYSIIVRGIKGSYVTLKNGHFLFTRKGEFTFSRVLNEYALKKGETALVSTGTRVVKGNPLYTLKNGKEVLSENIAIAEVRDNIIYLTGQEQTIEIRNGSEVVVKENDVIKAGETVGTFDPFADPILAEYDGFVRFEDILPGTTLKEEADEETGVVEKRISDAHFDKMQPRIFISDESGNTVGEDSYFLPGGAQLLVEEGQEIKAGAILAKIAKESVKTKDITGGLPRVSELLEARRPKSPAVLAAIAGVVTIKKGLLKGKRTIMVRDEYGHDVKHLVPIGKRMLVRDGDTVKAGEPLCDGSFDPHDILNILGENALQNYLMKEIKEVYDAQGVTINDKHVGIIVRQMLRKVKIVSVGDTKFIFDQQIDKYRFHEENKRVKEEGGQPAVARPMFQGITKAALNIDSFISAASFQETTKVLTNAAIAGSSDELRGLKENVIIGHLIPAGTGMKQYRDIKLFDKNKSDLDIQMNEILERRRLEAEAAQALEEKELIEEENFLDDL
ncbi:MULTISPECIES: DNA-directed RNA polymerase subunit beta' [Treponema]|uniref:DNA-directed RNA polymerase subunit beta' n=1 Tax=Treponema denticola (strain ATCC 35405 / DSM 14222 / CIP 103919 / JCM 8153 / KCTC 15104) TaxID=243275 RepID=RPOC_TREDE|nr:MULTISPECIES: DNA-directed RNA polymerase subunit beta' [Treponema]Q73JJ8.1 RecName: Full=DNA-directed RNA polymerase subunit beta'; Short=RNAP subunit beta'; AltName: Full=RNA polymerase subunit beta'; AltName: Full=Transcriptase subunit beta' [Treponema denticola ATCC 35405]AAS12938.1 DNA-directed RNA polymerase, beta' subunit, putative [Treponema denticola ATCC 35405]EMB38069.1 DNA-directed RNA polymerase subunit beta' [Treponema denticola ATCC 35404]EMB40079.1 DNA-directed RNA polymerase